jgi:CHASE2 domain-containing sensor protein
LASTILSNKPLRAILIAVPVLAALALSYFRVLDVYELQTFDWRCQLRGPRPVSSDVALIEIDDKTLEYIGRWPFKREFHAQLIDCLSKLGAKAVVFDILFVEPTDDDAFIAEMARSAKNVYFSDAFAEPDIVKGRFESKQFAETLVASLQEAAKGTGFVNVKTDLDGKRRRIYPIIFHEGKPYEQLAFKVAMDMLDVKSEEIKLNPGKNIEVGNRFKIPVDEDGHLIITFAGRWSKTFHHYPYAKILYAYAQQMKGEAPMMDLGEIKGKVFFVGLTALGSHDMNPTPLESVYPMVGVYANVYNSIIQKDFISRADRILNLILFALMGFWVLFLSVRFKPLKALLFVLSSVALYLGLVLAAFFVAGFWIDLFYPMLTFVLIYAVATLTRTLVEMKKREAMEGELKIASQIQRSFLPEYMPEHHGLEVAVFMKPAKAVGGDLYSFLVLDKDKLGVMVGDVSGKGSPAALFMAKVVSEFKFSAREKRDPSAVLVNLNDSIASESTGGLFVTLTYVIFDTTERKMLLSNGGHLPVVCVNRQGASELINSEKGMPIGVMPGTEFANATRSLSAGECFALYSDGVSEARNKKADEYGVERLAEQIKKHREKTAQQIVIQTIEDLNLFMGKASQHDDITLVVVKISPDLDEKQK